jgi:hypothetical protein
MAEEKKELARLGPYVFTEGTFDPAADILRLGTGQGAVRSWTAPQGDQVFSDPATGDVVGLVVPHYQERLWDGPIEILLPPAGEGEKPSGHTLFLALAGNPGSMCC